VRLARGLFVAVAVGVAGSLPAQDANSGFGHRAYREAAAEFLRPVGRYRQTDREVQLTAVAAAAFESMRGAARADTVHLVPVSGFRTVAYERGLFTRAIRRHGTPERAARHVAPPGYSEHHTGLAIDIGDSAAAACDAEVCFAGTRAGAWLLRNAGRFGFELSFPDGSGAVSYEPWHFRYIGDGASRAVFAAARAN
jgi:D-alanyl-D-alanine carboxypeptidase